MNLPVPIFLSLIFTERFGRIGMCVAILALLLFGHLLCRRGDTIRRPLLAGGIVVGVSQLWPALQIMAGFIGLEVATMLGLGRRIGSEFAGGVVTLATGGILMLAAYFLGRLLRAITPNRWWPDLRACSQSVTLTPTH